MFLKAPAPCRCGQRLAESGHPPLWGVGHRGRQVHSGPVGACLWFLAWRAFLRDVPTGKESCEAGLSLALFGEEVGRAAGSVLARQPRAQPPGGALCPMSPDCCSAPRCSSGFSSSPLFPWPHRGHQQGAGGQEQTLSRAGKRADWRSSSSSRVSLGRQAGSWVCLSPVTVRLGHVY